MSAGWWAGIGGIAAVAALVPIVLNRNTPAGDEAAAENYCSAIGTQNTVNCTFVPEPQSMAKISFEPNLGGGRVFFAGSPDDLPKPPDYRRASAHCIEWYEWFRATPNIYLMDASVDVHLEAGEPDVVTVTDVGVEIFSRTPIARDEGLAIQCHYGGGSNEYYVVDVDTLRQTTTITVDSLSGGTPQLMPPASISLDKKGFSTVRVSVKSQPGYLYSGRIVVSAVVNGAKTEMAVGSPEAPLRWVAATSDPERSTYDWDMKARQWVKDYSPFN